MTLARRTSVVVPAFNEEHAVGPIVNGLQSAAEWLETSPQGWADVRRFVQALERSRGPFAATAPDQNRRKRFA